LMCVGPRGGVCVMCVCVVEMELDGAIGAIDGTKVEPRRYDAENPITKMIVRPIPK
jgi:hypothetical protein